MEKMKKIIIAVFVIFTIYSCDMNSIEEKKNYNITFDNNGGTGNMVTLTKTEGSKVKLSVNTFEKIGYYFTG